SGENDFGLWRIKMEAILIQHGWAEALKGDERMSESLSSKEKLEMIDRAREMTESRTATEQLADFNKILDDLENIEVKLEEEDKALLLLNSLPKSFEPFKDAILGKDQDITLEEVHTSIRTKEMQKQQDSKSEDNGESLNISRGRSEKKGTRGKKSRS
ncbi:Retrovirus-related Pol polyprotein from transposon TNT 1-94, partial [Glycine soja]